MIKIEAVGLSRRVEDLLTMNIITNKNSVEEWRITIDTTEDTHQVISKVI